MGFSNNLVYDDETAQTVIGSAFPLDNEWGWSATGKIVVTTPAAKTFIDANVTVATDVIAIASHGYKTGLKGQLTTDGVLPAGLALLTDYFVIVVTAGTIKLASSLNNANAGTAVDITAAAGGGTHTFTATALAGATLKYQACNDLGGASTDTWVDLTTPASQALTVTANYLVNVTDALYRWVRPVTTLTAGQLDVEVRVNAKST